MKCARVCMDEFRGFPSDTIAFVSKRCPGAWWISHASIFSMLLIVLHGCHCTGDVEHSGTRHPFTNERSRRMQDHQKSFGAANRFQLQTRQYFDTTSSSQLEIVARSNHHKKKENITHTIPDSICCRHERCSVRELCTP